MTADTRTKAQRVETAVEEMRRWAEGLICQLPEDHDGRNSWLLNHGSPSISEPLRERWEKDAGRKMMPTDGDRLRESLALPDDPQTPGGVLRELRDRIVTRIRGDKLRDCSVQDSLGELGNHAERRSYNAACDNHARIVQGEIDRLLAAPAPAEPEPCGKTVAIANGVRVPCTLYAGHSVGCHADVKPAETEPFPDSADVDEIRSDAAEFDIEEFIRGMGEWKGPWAGVYGPDRNRLHCYTQNEASIHAGFRDRDIAVLLHHEDHSRAVGFVGNPQHIADALMSMLPGKIEPFADAERERRVAEWVRGYRSMVTRMLGLIISGASDVDDTERNAIALMRDREAEVARLRAYAPDPFDDSLPTYAALAKSHGELECEVERLTKERAEAISVGREHMSNSLDWRLQRDEARAELARARGGWEALERLRNIAAASAEVAVSIPGASVLAGPWIEVVREITNMLAARPHA